MKGETDRLMPAPRDALAAALTAAIDAGRRVMEVYEAAFGRRRDEDDGAGAGCDDGRDGPADTESPAGRTDALRATSKADGSPVTTADTRAHEAIMTHLTGAFPALPVVSEEGEIPPFAERCTWQRWWLVDPLDGTREFVAGRREFTVNIALVDSREGPVVGVVYQPAEHLLYVGMARRGAWRARDDRTDPRSIEKYGTPLPSVAEIADRPYGIVASRSHASPATIAYIETRRRIHGNLEVTYAGSSLKFCRVAEGSADEYPRFGPTMEWDTAAADAVARAAGCRVTEWDPARRREVRPLMYNKADLTNPGFLVSR